MVSTGYHPALHPDLGVPVGGFLCCIPGSSSATPRAVTAALLALPVNSAHQSPRSPGCPRLISPISLSHVTVCCTSPDTSCCLHIPPLERGSSFWKKYHFSIFQSSILARLPPRPSGAPATNRVLSEHRTVRRSDWPRPQAPHTKQVPCTPQALRPLLGQ